MSPAPAGYRLTEITPDRVEEYRGVDAMAFAEPAPDPATEAAVPFAVPVERAVAIEADGGELVAVHGSYAFALPVPGDAAVPCAGLTWVGVRPDHRRRGLLSTMIRAHLDRSIARGEIVSALFAAEPGIYGRFGYGSASDDLKLTLPRGAALREVPGSADLTVRFASLDPARHEGLVEQVYAAAAHGRPGWIRRGSDALRRVAVADPPAWRRGGEPARLVTVHDAAGEPRAFAIVRRTQKWEDGGPGYTVAVRLSAAVDAAAAHRLWSFLVDLDLTASVTTGMLAVDDPLLALLVDTRRPVPKVTDNLWVRLLDVPAALAARRYAAPVDVTLGVRDALLPANAGTWRLVTGEAGPDGTYPARVERADGAPDLELDVRELGAAYLGGRSLAALAAAGQVTAARPDVLHRAATAFGWPVAPVCPWVF
ncbi:GNAT family N-acetyltransferase [Cellulomonas hominis]|uniref:GNAT family N-acetyltransferase n=1 Tax=Cellulomonas hominis TaxID=156981 RepID=UPI001C1163A9|nr:GNAT family N-acetyltransferase [Cellulomonas hominis]MBU5423815.1 GNAT family N-acetyltransferase [Cellulomonas hominis]